jgi:hypothetical protein
MKKLFTSIASAQSYTIKTIVKDKQITGYLIINVSKDKTISNDRICYYSEIERLGLRKQAKLIISHDNIQTDKLEPEEYLKNGVKNNEL